LPFERQKRQELQFHGRVSCLNFGLCDPERTSCRKCPSDHALCFAPISALRNNSVFKQVTFELEVRCPAIEKIAWMERKCEER
jgi:hypothetical protein